MLYLFPNFVSQDFEETATAFISFSLEKQQKSEKQTTRVDCLTKRSTSGRVR